jgi:nitrate/nitrite-specific signal transduction histidine kinase
MISALNIKHKLLVLIGLVVIGFSSLLVLAITQINEIRVGGELYETLETYDFLIRELVLLRANLGESRMLSTDALYATDADRLKMLHRRVQELSKHVKAQFEKSLQAATDDSVEAALASARFTWDEFSKTNEAMFQSMLRGGRQFSRHVLDMQRLRQERFTEQIDSAINILALEDEDLEEQSKSSVARRIRVLVVGGAGLALLIICLTFVIARSIAAPLRQLSEACERVARGSFTEKVEIVGRDEIGAQRIEEDAGGELGQVARAFNEMAARVAESRASLEGRVAELAALQKVGTTLTSTLHLPAVLEALAESAIGLIGASRCAVFELDPNDQRLYARGSRGMRADQPFMPMKLGQGAAGSAVLLRRVVFNPDVHREPLPMADEEWEGTGKTLREVVRQRGYRAILAVPLVSKENVLGAICIYWDEVHSYDERQVRLVTAVAQQAAVAIENARLHEETRTAARKLEERNTQLRILYDEVQAHRSQLAERVRDLEDALARVKQLQGLLPICAWCKKVRKDQNYWQSVESYVSEHSEARFSHGICPDCKEKFVTKRREE